MRNAAAGLMLTLATPLIAAAMAMPQILGAAVLPAPSGCAMVTFTIEE